VGEIGYRLATGGLLALLMAVRIVYGLAARRARGLRGRPDPEDMLAIGGVGFGLVLLASYGVLPLPSFLHVPLPPLARWIGAALFAAGDLVFWWTHASLGDSWSVSLGTSESQRLVTRGPYRFVRHPMYSAIALTAAGALVLTANWLAGGAYAVAFAAMYAGRVDREERALLEAFGEEYREYMDGTPRLVLRPSALIDVLRRRSTGREG
jgi:protein-S-isoprenylcysteine O-methyltransferase Ste14